MQQLVDTFVVESDSFNPWGQHESLTAASAVLPTGSYTTLRTYGRDRVLRLDLHVRRLEESLASPTQLGLTRVRSALARSLALTRHDESRVRLTFAPPRLFLSVERFVPLPEGARLRGVRCVTLRGLQRETPHAKRTEFIAAAANRYESLGAGIEEGLMVAADGSILEGLSSNFFAVRKGELLTEHERVLHGVTRAIVLEIARALLNVRREALRVFELERAEEAFLTSVSREIAPVVEIDGTMLGTGQPGPVTGELLRRFAALVAQEAEPVGA